MKIKVRVKLIEKVGQTPYYGVYLVDQLGVENIVRTCIFKREADLDDKYWGENTARNEALQLAKEIEQIKIKSPEEKIIYETPIEND